MATKLLKTIADEKGTLSFVSNGCIAKTKRQPFSLKFPKPLRELHKIVYNYTCLEDYERQFSMQRSIDNSNVSKKNL